MIIEKVNWDSEFFNIKIGKLTVNNNKYGNIVSLLNSAKNDGYKLIYVFGDSQLNIDHKILKTYGGKLVDRKVLYSQKVNNNLQVNYNVEEYNSDILSKDLEYLTYLSGSYSRYKLDLNFAKDDFSRLYKTWIEKSLRKVIADKVFVIRFDNEICAMMTLKLFTDYSQIGLFSVSDKIQGKGLGRSLINTGINFTLFKNLTKISVPTQIDNVVACRFYEKCGFEVESISNIYHFWFI